MPFICCFTGDIFSFFYYIKEVRNQEWTVEGNWHPHKGYILKDWIKLLLYLKYLNLDNSFNSMGYSTPIYKLSAILCANRSSKQKI